MSSAVVVCEKVEKTYQKDSVPVHALSGVDFEVSQGDFVSLSGPSGSGKSTLLNVIGGLDRPDAGEVTVDGVALSTLSESELTELRLRKMGFVFQAYNLIPVLSAMENVEFILQLQGVPAAERRARAEAVLESLGLADMSHRQPGELSGGQQQRLCIARTIAVNPEVILMDEPCSALDPIATARIEDLIDELSENYVIVIVTHSMQQAARVSQRVAYFHLGALVEVDSTDKVFTNPTHKLTENYITGRFG